MNINRSYSENFKQAAIKKWLAPGSKGIKAIARELGIAPSTIFGWKEKYAIDGGMKKHNLKKVTNKWSPSEKLEAVIKQATLTEQEFGEYLRANGLFSKEVDGFKKEILVATSNKGRPKIDKEILELRHDKNMLEKNINRKDRALAEMSARIVLLKKSHLLWGDPEDEVS